MSLCTKTVSVERERATYFNSQLIATVDIQLYSLRKDRKSTNNVDVFFSSNNTSNDFFVSFSVIAFSFCPRVSVLERKEIYKVNIQAIFQ